MVYRAWKMRQQERGTIKKLVEEGADMPVLGETLETVYVSSLAIARDVNAVPRPNELPGYYMLPWTHYKLLILVRSRV